MKRICSFQHYYALHSRIVYMKYKCASTIYWRSAYLNDKMCLIDHPVYVSSLSVYPKSESSSNFINVRKCNHKPEAVEAGMSKQDGFRTCSQSVPSNDMYSSSRLQWKQAGLIERFLKVSKQICHNHVNNCVESQGSWFSGAGEEVSQNLFNRSETVDVVKEGDTVADGSIYKNINILAVSLGNHMPEVSNSLATPNGSANFDPRQMISSQASGSTFQCNGSPSQEFDPKENIPECISGEKNAFTRVLKEDGCAENSNKSSTAEQNTHGELKFDREVHLKKLIQIYDKILIVDSVSAAKRVVQMLMTKYKNHIHACDTEVAGIDVKQETPVGHGEVICFSIYSGPQADFGNGKSCIWVDLLDGERNILQEFAPFFADTTVKKVWHNYSFDYHAIENHGIKVSGFHADTMHLARLWDSSRRNDGGYSLEALTGDSKVMSGQCSDKTMTIGKTSMKYIFGRNNAKKDGSEGKLIAIPPIEVLQREARIPWICYSALDSISTLKLFNSLKYKLSRKGWFIGSEKKGSMYDFYKSYWHPFGDLLVKMESEGMLVDRAYLAEIEKVAAAEKQVAADRFRNWAAKYCSDARYMNVGSDAQIRQLFFGGVQNRKHRNESLPKSKTFKVPNIEKVIEVEKMSPSKYMNITLANICKKQMETHLFTATGWPSVCGDALKSFAGNVSADELCVTGDHVQFDSDDHRGISTGGSNIRHSEIDPSACGRAYAAFGKGREGTEACHAIAALCEVCSIDSLMSNFILPLQGNYILGKDGRIHCSLNINTETGRLSARRPNLQNQPALEKDRYKIRRAFVAEPGNCLIVADYGQLELRLLAHLADCKSMLDAFKAGGDFHSRTAMNMYDYIQEAVLEKRILVEWHPQPGEEKPPVPLLKDVFAAERRKAKMLNFSIAYGKTPVGLSRDWKVSIAVAQETVDLWYKERNEVLTWQEKRKKEALEERCVHTLLGRARMFPSVRNVSGAQRGHIERAAINTPVQGSAADVAMCAMLQIAKNSRLMELKWKLLLQVHDEVILEGPIESAEAAKAIVIDCMSKPFNGQNILKVDLAVDAKCVQNWYAAK